MDTKQIYQTVQERYGETATHTVGGEHEQTVAKAFGYTEEELADIPREANLGVSCGNPLALAKLKEVCPCPPASDRRVYLYEGRIFMLRV